MSITDTVVFPEADKILGLTYFTKFDVSLSEMILNLEHFSLALDQASLAQVVKNLPVMQETWVRFLGQENPLQEGMVTHSTISAWRIPWIEEPGRL